MTVRKEISFLQVLCAMAWADGTLDPQELNYLKDLLFKLDLTGEEYAQIEMYLEEPVTPEEAKDLLEDFFRGLGGHGEKTRLIATLQEMAEAVGTVTQEEKALLRQFADLMENTHTGSLLFRKLKGIFGRTVFQQPIAKGRALELHDYLNNRILFRLKRRLRRKRLMIEAHQDELMRACLFGGLLALVAHAESGISREEVSKVQELLSRSTRFEPETIELILEILKDQATRDLDRFRLAREFYSLSTPTQRAELLDALFEVAGADHKLSHEEVEEIRHLASLLKFTHKEFIEAKLHHRRVLVEGSSRSGR